jgi:hypothetical protein
VKDEENSKFLIDLFYLIQLKIFYEKHKNDKIIYFGYFLDFRGRLYYDSPVGITTFKLSRYFFYGGYYCPKDLSFVIDKSISSEAYQLVLNQINTTDEHLAKICHPDYLSGSLNDKFRNFKRLTLLNLLIYLGFQNKNKIFDSCNRDPNSFQINMTEFFNQGCSEISEYLKNNKNNEKRDIEEFLLSEKLINLILNKPNFLRKDLLSYDFSCSGHVMRYNLCKLKDLNNFVYLNLSGNFLYTDIYRYIIVKFKKLT